MTSSTLSIPGLALTPRAIDGARALIRQRGEPALKLRLLVNGGGGCADFEYQFLLDDDQNDEDVALDFDGVTVLLDPVSRKRAVGVRIDFVEELDGARFVVLNTAPPSAPPCRPAPVAVPFRR